MFNKILHELAKVNEQVINVIDYYPSPKKFHRIVGDKLIVGELKDSECNNETMSSYNYTVKVFKLELIEEKKYNN